MKKTIQILAGLALAASFGCSHAPKGPEPAREPAADLLSIVEAADLRLYQDFFHTETHQKQLRQNVRFKLWTDMDSQYLKDKTKQALDEAIAKTFAPNGEGKLVEKLKRNIMSEFLEEFVKTLTFYKIVNGTIQFDFYFLPEADSPSDFSNELASNRLIRLKEAGTLGSKLQELDTWTVTGQFARMRSSLAQLSNPGAEGDYRYAGGVISINIKLLDMRWDIFHRPIPNTKKNAVKGFVRYRRYFIRKDLKSDLDACGKLAFSSENSQGSGRQFVTVDIYKGFNLANFLPQRETLEVFPGRLIASNQGRKELIGAKDFVGKTLKTGTLTLSVEVSDGKTPLKARHEIRSLVYSFDKQEFDSLRSSIRSNAEIMRSPPDEDWPNLNDAGTASRFRVLQTCGSALSKALALDRFSNDLAKEARR